MFYYRVIGVRSDGTYELRGYNVSKGTAEAIGGGAMASREFVEVRIELQPAEGVMSPEAAAAIEPLLHDQELSDSGNE